MTKDFVSILDLMPDIFEMAKREMNGFFNVRRYASRGDLYQYDVQTTENGQKQLLFIDARYRLVQKYSELTGIVVDESAETTHRNFIDNHAPYCVGYAYDVPEILEVYYLRQTQHIDYMTEAYLQIVENMYYHHVLSYVRSCDPSENITDPEYQTDKATNLIYRQLTIGDKLFTLDMDDDTFNDKVKALVLDKAEKISRIKKPTKSDKSKLGYLCFPARDLEDLLDYQEFYEGHARRYGSRSYEYLTHYLPTLILFVAIEQQKKSFIGASYPEYANLVSRLPVSLNRNSEGSPEDWDIEEEISRHMTLTTDDIMTVMSYGHGIGFSSNYNVSLNQSEFLDSEINRNIYAHLFNQIRLMMFQDGDIPVPIDSLQRFENEIWRQQAGLRLTLNTSTLEWGEPNE